jgi:hypothetical protein
MSALIDRCWPLWFALVVLGVLVITVSAHTIVGLCMLTAGGGLTIAALLINGRIKQ